MMDNQAQIQAELENPQTEQAALKKEKRMSIFVTALLVAAVILCLFVVSQVLSKGYISIAGHSMFRVATGSMEPELSVGTLLISKRTPIDEIREGDIVNFQSRSSDMLGAVITHRVTAVLQGADGQIYLETKGDANPYPDASYVQESNLVGRVVYTTGNGNFLAELVSILTNPVGFLACIVLPCLTIGVFTMRDCIHSMKKQIDSLETQAEGEEPYTGMDEQEYQALCERLRGELLEELKHADQEETTE